MTLIVISDYGQVAKDYLSTPKGVKKMVVQPTLKTMDWVKLQNGGLSPDVARAETVFKGANKFLDWFTLPEKVSKVFRSWGDFTDHFSKGKKLQMAKSSVNLFTNSTAVLGIFAGSLKLAHKQQWLTLSTWQFSVINALGLMGAISMVIGSLKGIVKQIGILRSDVDQNRKVLALFQLISKVLLAVTGCIGVAVFANGSAVVAKVVALSISTVLLAISLTAYFFENVHIKRRENLVDL